MDGHLTRKDLGWMRVWSYALWALKDVIGTISWMMIGLGASCSSRHSRMNHSVFSFKFRQAWAHTYLIFWIYRAYCGLIGTYATPIFLVGYDKARRTGGCVGC